MAEPTPQDPQTESPPAEAQTTEHMIPKSRLDQALNERNELRERLTQLEAAQKKTNDEALVEQNRYKELYEQARSELDTLKAAKEQATRYSAALQATNEARLKQVPEEKQSYVPEYDDPVKLGTWLDENLPKLVTPGKPTPPPMDGSAGATPPERSAKLTEQQRAFIAATGISEDAYIAQLAKRGQPIDLTQHKRQADNQQE